ncbi:sulfatase-like hydrolase/transferase [Shewanella sp. UCD-KL21]|uniref:sulfatase-like hydrolase/transferase n=1 Tax=Shewanella sp. UCD-KL21 TaxID=1917164 RepID=UPI0009704062|nr:sulfatase-like hydrolase/transferase [Shewanella sp. UCD-KL21]
MPKTATSKAQHSAPSISMMRTYFRTLAVLIFLIVIAFNYKQLIQDHSPFSIATAMTHIKTQHLLSQGLLFDLGFFAAMVVTLHACWAAIITLSCRPWFQYCHNDNIKTQIWIVILLLHCILVVAANSYLYPTSLLGIFRGTILVEPWLLWGLLFLLLSNFMYALFSSLSSYKTRALLSLLIITIGSVYVFSNNTLSSSNKQVNELPNIFVIGIDGLRPDHLAHRGADYAIAPKLNQLLAKSLIYDKAYTPQARTYVAWMGILSGQYPVNNGARFNLAPPELVNTNLPLLNSLSSKGYQTTYAMDERRFNQIDEQYGFDRIVGPKVGAADAIIANVADIPLVNLAINTPISGYMFPYLYINRAYGKAYDPMRFNQEVLNALSTESPNFLAVHFCQLHWPFTSKDFIELDKSRWDGNYNHYMHRELIKTVDVQIADFISGLRQRGMLDNAIVYLLSDHGEGFLLPQDRLTAATEIQDDNNNPRDKIEKLNVAAWGHGTNILSQEQSQVLLASLRYHHGEPINHTGKVPGLFSLIDIAPTIVASFKSDSTNNDWQFDGIALPQMQTALDDSRFVFVESSLPVRAINTSFIDDNKVMSETASQYEVRDNGRAVMKPEFYKNNIALKQRSVYAKQWQLAMLPKDERLILINTDTMQWHNLANYQGNAPWQKMLTALCNHYQTDLVNMPKTPCQNALGLYSQLEN